MQSEAREDGRTRRRIDADLTIRAGMMAGSLAERIIIGIIRRQFDREAKMLNALLAEDAQGARRTG